MKLSMFLFLLHFTLSTSVYFKIVKEPGLHLWNVPDNEYSDADYMKIKNLNTSEVRISKSSWSVRDISGSSSVKQSTSILETSNTYIILHISKEYEYSLYYWIGAQSSEQKRKIVAVSVGLIFKNKILEQTPKVKLKLFNREAEGMESILFTKLFNLRILRRQSRLYRVAGSKGQFIMEVPLKHSELNGSDSFVLDKFDTLYQLDSIYSNKHKKLRAESLKNRIFNGNTSALGCKPYFIWIREGDPNTRQNFDYEKFKTEFLKDLTGVPESQEFPQAPNYYTDSELENKRREDVILYEYSRCMLKHVTDPQQIPWTVLKFKMLKEDNAYVLVDKLCGNIIVYLGSNASIEQIIMSLSDAEKHSTRIIGVNDAWKRVRVLRQRPKFPTWFRIYFENES